MAVLELWSEDASASLPLDMRLVRLAGALFWLIGAATLALIAAFWPPTQRIAWPGWLVAGALFVVCLAVAVRRLDSGRRTSLDEILGAGYAAVVGIAVLQWLAGGYSPYHYLFALPVLFVPAVHSPRRVVAFLVVVVVAALAPLTYEDVSSPVVGDILVQLAMLLAIAGVIRTLFVLLRRQRAALRDALGRAEMAARRDPLTGLGNRLAFEEAVDVEVARARRGQTPLSVIVGDLDNFKAVNDELGHLAGDELLRRAAEALRASARRSDECFRWGGDEFVVLLPSTRAEQARELCKRVREAVGGLDVSGRRERLEMTCASAELRANQTAEDLLATADEILTALKTHRGGPTRARLGDRMDAVEWVRPVGDPVR